MTRKDLECEPDDSTKPVCEPNAALMEKIRAFKEKKDEEEKQRKQDEEERRIFDHRYGLLKADTDSRPAGTKIESSEELLARLVENPVNNCA